MNRRHFLLGCSAVAAGAVSGEEPPGSHGKHRNPGARPARRPGAGVAGERFSTPLQVPGAAGGYATLDLAQPLKLEAQYVRTALFPGRLTDLMAYRAQVGGRDLVNPLLRARTGAALDVTLANRLGEDTTIHWHGLKVDERNDGSGLHPVRHGADFLYRFSMPNRAGLYWYHPHPHGRTGAQIHLGMGGMLLVTDAEEEALQRELGLAFGDTDVALMLQDKQVDERNRIRYSMGEDDWIGNRVLVNLTAEPYFEARTCLYRFRILNASNARTYLLAFMQGERRLAYSIIGTDGGLLARPRTATECFLAPAQRLDVLLDLGKELAGTSVMMRSLRYDPMENDGGAPDAGMEHPGAPALGEPMDLMRIDIKVPVCAPRALPRTLSSLAGAPRGAGPLRRFRLHMAGTRWLINGRNHHDDPGAIRESVKRGARETWEIVNDMKSMPHPMHLHGFQFHVLSRHGSPAQVRRLAVTPEGLTPQDLGLQDTVLVWPGERVRLAVDFAQPFSGEQRYMFHCHNLEHEDQGMMLDFSVR